MKFFSKDKQRCLADKVRVADRFFDRLVGLMFTKEMVGYDGLLIKYCTSIHTFFMLQTIDVLFLDNNFVVQKIIRNMKPWRVSAIYFRSTQVLELSKGTIGDDVNVGDKLEIS